MALAESIFAKLSAADSATAAIVGAGSACRVYPGEAPIEVARPYVVVTEVFGDNEAATHDATSDFERMTVQFSCVADTWVAARNLRKAIRADLTDTTLAGGEKAVSFLPRQGFSETLGMHLAELDVEIWHNPLA
jgi:hypothetical protein